MGETFLNTQHLRYVAEVARTGSITKAAKNLYMGQPNLSKAIKELEAEMGITIFKRTAQGVAPTIQGENFLAYAQTILSQLDELEALYKPQSDPAFSLNISVPRATYISIAFTHFIDTVAKDKPINIHFKETNSTQAINDVNCGESSIAIIRYQSIYENYFLTQLESLDIKYETLKEFTQCLLLSKNHPFANASDIPYHALDGFIEVVHGDFQVPSLSFSKINRQAKMKESKKQIFVYERGSQFDILKHVDGSYMWISPIPFSVLSEHGLIQKQCSTAQALNKDILIYRNGHIFSKEEKAFLNFLKMTIAEEIV